MKHLLTLFDLSVDDVKTILATAAFLKKKLAEGQRPSVLKNRVLALLFEKPSLRTRVSFEAGIAQLGGSSLFLGEDVGWKKRESPFDFTNVLGEFVDAVACRAKSHEMVETLASFDAMPIINSLTDVSHPCQALADALTIQEAFGDLAGRHVVFVGDGNNVSASLALVCAMLDMRFTLACPDGYEIEPAWLARIKQQYPDSSINRVVDPLIAVSDADAIYTDVWTSMGQEAESAIRKQAFKAYQVNEALMAATPDHARVLHCLPAIRGEEITDAVIDSSNSDTIAQAGNRMHAQKGLLVWLLNPGWIKEQGI